MTNVLKYNPAMQFESVNKIIERSVRDYWELPSISNYKGATLCYKDVARKMEKLHILFEECGVQKGDRIAISSRNQANWAVSFFATLTYGAVPVPLLHEFKPGNVHHLVNHSESKILFVDEIIWEGLEIGEMPELQAVVQVNSLQIIYSAGRDIDILASDIEAAFESRFPQGVRPEDLNYHEDSAEELAVLNYTSGTSGFSKGVMIPYRALWSNIIFARDAVPQLKPGCKVVSMLPAAHMYGLMFEVFYEFTRGVHIYFLTRVPSPKIILQAMKEVRPDIVIAVPLIIEKVYKNTIKPVIEKSGAIRFLLKLPVLDQIVLKKIKNQICEAFGGNFEEVIIGGAALNKEVDNFFHKIGFPYTVGYGMTECAPIIGYAHWNVTKPYSCGKLAPNLEIMIDSPDSQNVPGEILVKGANVFLGYYRNPEATSASFTEDGWFRTGDMGVIDSEGFIFLRGRNKCMILGPSGQNIYPEEIEGVINNVRYVVDSLVIEDKGLMTALIYPDFAQAQADGLDAEALEKFLNEAVAEASKDLANYSRVKKIEIMPEDFERTPKKSIKRYLYQRQ